MQQNLKLDKSHPYENLKIYYKKNKRKIFFARQMLEKPAIFTGQAGQEILMLFDKV